MWALISIVIILAAGAAALYFYVIKPSAPKGLPCGKIVILLEDLAPLWTRHNKEVIPLLAKELEKPDNNDVLDALVKSKKGGQPANAGAPETMLPAAESEAPIIPAAENSTPPTGLSISALDKPLMDIWEDCIEPHREMINMQGAEEVIMTLLRLIEKHGHYPSVVIDSHDDESTDLITVRDNLTQTTLRDHTYSVVRNMISIMNKSMIDPKPMIPSALIMALGHDIGKIPEFRATSAYNSKDHAQVGAAKLAEIMQGRNEFWVKKVINAVRNHHSATKDDQTTMLKQADRQARQTELVAYTHSYQVIAFDKWFDVKKYLIKYIVPGVNTDKTGKWNAFSFMGSIYAKPDWLYEQARRMCQDEKILDMTFVYGSEKDSAQRIIVSALRRENLTPLLGEGFYARKFDVKTSVGVQKLTAYFLTAFLIPDYINIAELESRKTGFTEIISTVKPLT
jgi:hypothetical protein